MGDEHNFVFPGGQFRIHQAVAFFQVDGDDARLAVVDKVVQAGFFDRAVLCGEDDVAAVLREGDVIALFIHPAFQTQNGGNGFFRLEVQQVFDVAALCAAGGFVNFVHTVHVHAPGVREEHQVVVVLGGEQVLDEVRFRILFRPLRGSGFHALAAARLHAVFRGVGAFDVAAVRDGDNHRVVRDQVFNGHVPGERDDTGDARRGIFVLDGHQLVLHDAQHAGFVGQNVQIVLDPDEELHVVRGDFVVFQGRQLVQAQVQDGVYLAFREDVAVLLHGGLGTDQDAEAFRRLRGEGICLEAFTGFLPVFGVADDADEVVHVAQGQQEGFQPFGVLLGVAQQVARAAHDHLAPVLNVEVDGVQHGERLGPVVVNRQHVHGEGGLHGRELVELVHDHLRTGVPLELDFNAGFFVGKVADAGDVRQYLVLVQFRDAFLKGGAVYAVGNFPDDEQVLAGIRLLNVDLAADAHGTASGAEVVVNAGEAQNVAPGGEVRPLDELAQFIHRHVRGVDYGADAVHHFPQVVRRHVGGHPHRNPGAAVHQQVGEGGREDGGFRMLVVVRGNEVHRILVQVRHQGDPHAGELSFRVSGGGGRVTVRSTEVTLADDQDVAHGPVLRHIHQRAVNGGISVRVVVTHRVPHDLGAFAGLPARAEVQFLHGVENAPLGRLEAVSHVRQGAGDDDGHGVVQEGGGQLVGYVHRFDSIVFHGAEKKDGD